MSWADSRLQDNVQLYESYTPLPDGTVKVRYAYGAPWIAMALYLDDLAFDTPEAAIAWWEKEYE